MHQRDIDRLASQVHSHVFELLDLEIDISGPEAAYVATACEQVFSALLGDEAATIEMEGFKATVASWDSRPPVSSHDIDD